MELDSFDWLDCSLFLLLASAEVTDHYLTEQEIHSILEKADVLIETFKIDGITHDAVRQKFSRAFEWYDHIGESAPKDHMNGHVTTTIFKVAQHMKAQDWFSEDFAQTLLNGLVDLAAADGETIKNEQHLINRIALDWKLKKPFS